MFIRPTRALVFAALALLAATGISTAHEKHTEETPQAPITNTPRIESVGSEIELVATAEAHTLTIYLDRLATNAPVEGAEIEVSGEGKEPVKAKMIAPGTYVIEAGWVDIAGTHPLLFTIIAGETAELLNGTLMIPEHDHSALDAVLPFRDIVGRADFLAAIGGAFVLGCLIAIALRRRRASVSEAQAGATLATKAPPLRNAAEMIVIGIVVTGLLMTPVLAGPGHDHGDGGAAPSDKGDAPRKRPDGTVFVPKPTQRLLNVRTEPALEQSVARSSTLLGTVVSDPSAFGQVQAPMDGQIEVSERGISFAGQKVSAGEVLALLTPAIPLADLGTMQQLRAEVDGKLIIAEQKLSRLTRIANVVAQRDIDDTRAELDALREQKRVLAPKGVEKIELKAPVSGVISVANVRAGQVVSSRDMLFEIVDPDRLWIEAVGTTLHSDGDAQNAHAIDNHNHSIKLKYMGRSPTLRQQLQPLLFQIDEAHSGLAIGAPVKVLVETAEFEKGLIVPDAAIVRGANGLQQVWVKLSPELFRAVTVRTAPIDGKRTVAMAGLQPGDRVVVSGAELINQIR